MLGHRAPYAWGSYRLAFPATLLGCCEYTDFLIENLTDLSQRLQLHMPEIAVNNYGQEVQKLVDNFRITVSSNGSLSFSLTTNDGNLNITSVHTRRETSHHVKMYPDLLLHLVELGEVPAAQMQQSGHHEDMIHVDPMETSLGKPFWQVSIESVSANKILKENETLELGEVAQWQSRDLIEKGIIKDMYLLAEDIVTRIDAVGIRNQGFKSKSASKSRTSNKTGPKMQATQSFW